MRRAEQEAPRRERGELPPRRLDAPDTGHGVPPRRLEATGQNPRGEDVEQRPPAARQDIPALWGRPGPRPPESRPEPSKAEPKPGPPGPEPGGRASALVRRGRSIAGYKRHELVELVGHIAEREPDLTDEQLVELVTRLLGCPEDEALLVGARLRYAVAAYRESRTE